MEQLPVGVVHDIGYVFKNGQFRITTESTSALLSADQFIADAVLQLRKVRNVRVAQGARHLGRIYDTIRSVPTWWHKDVEQYYLSKNRHYDGAPRKVYDVSNITDDYWKTIECMLSMSSV